MKCLLQCASWRSVLCICLEEKTLPCKPNHFVESLLWLVVDAGCDQLQSLFVFDAGRMRFRLSVYPFEEQVV